MTEAMPFLQKAILLSYAPRPLPGAFFLYWPSKTTPGSAGGKIAYGEGQSRQEKVSELE